MVELLSSADIEFGKVCKVSFPFELSREVIANVIFISELPVQAWVVLIH